MLIGILCTPMKRKESLYLIYYMHNTLTVVVVGCLRSTVIFTRDGGNLVAYKNWAKIKGSVVA